MTEIEGLLSRLRDIETFTSDQPCMDCEGDICQHLVAQTVAEAADTITVLMAALEGLVKQARRDHRYPEALAAARAALREVGRG
jgi:hypothetical protein